MKQLIFMLRVTQLASNGDDELDDSILFDPRADVLTTLFYCNLKTPCFICRKDVTETSWRERAPF